MPFIITNSTTIAAIAIQAWPILVTRTTISTAMVITRPKPLIARLRCMRRRSAGSVSVRSSLVQCRIMPDWLMLKDTKTPTM